MANLKDKTLLYVCSGGFFETALSLADYYKEVLYYVQWTSGFPGMDKCVVGSEYKNGKVLDTFDGKPLRRVYDIYSHLEEVDIIMYSDVYDGEQAEFFRGLGYPVVSAGKGAELELDRWKCKMEFKGAGMDVNPAKRVIGIDALREELMKVKDRYVKISRFRKQTETFHHNEYILTEPLLSKMEHEMGPMSKIIEFIIEEPIDAVVEEGCDMYSVSGKYPQMLLAGVEIKDTGYAGMIMPYDKLSKGVKETNAQISGILKKVKYQGFISTEVRTTKSKEHYLIDMSCRLPQPPSALYGEMFDNLGDIVWALGQREVIDVKPKAVYGLYCTIYSEWYQKDHQAIYFPEKYRNNVKLSQPLKIDGQYYCLNFNNHPECGSIVTVGGSFEDCKKQMEEIAKEVKGYGVSVKTDSIDTAIEEFAKMMKGNGTK